MKVYLPYSFSNAVSIASRVVPAIFETIRRFSPRIVLIIELLPAFGFPITATLIVSSSSSTSASGQSSTMRSSRSPVPVP